ncbi:hypothetical protein C8R43DRAFT_124697 [Mycena crocata]|nr:hypothetical protein C8R43DRAFT_124697 [Mycena crocata]
MHPYTGSCSKARRDMVTEFRNVGSCRSCFSRIEPLLYRTLFVTDFPYSRQIRRPRITSERCLDMLQSKPASFFSDHTRHVALRAIPFPEVESILSKCSGLVNLGLFQLDHISQLLSMIAAMPLQRISCDVEAFSVRRDSILGIPCSARSPTPISSPQICVPLTWATSHV